jgi:predicted Zn-dependent protease
MTTPARRFANDDEAAQHWLKLLRDGDGEQKIQAREQLAAIFERRGMHEEATDLLVSNVRDGVRNADIFRWLARLYRAQGDEVTAMQAAA